MPKEKWPGWFSSTVTQREEEKTEVTSEVSVSLSGEMPIKLTFGPAISVTMSVGSAERLIGQLEMAIRMKELQDSGEPDGDQSDSNQG